MLGGGGGYYECVGVNSVLGAGSLESHEPYMGESYTVSQQSRIHQIKSDQTLLGMHACIIPLS